jgi:hypothetical protein
MHTVANAVAVDLLLEVSRDFHSLSAKFTSTEINLMVVDLHNQCGCTLKFLLQKQIPDLRTKAKTGAHSASSVVWVLESPFGAVMNPHADAMKNI